MAGVQERRGGHIHELDMELQLQILGLLPTKEAVKSGILSKAWLNLWKSVETIDFDSNCMGLDRNITKFLEIILRTVSRCSSPKVINFSLCMSHYPRQHRESINKILAEAIRRRAENITLRFRGQDPTFRAPPWLCNNAHVVNLKVQNWDMTVGPVHWTALRSLTLNNVNLDDETIGVILSGCPVLETLTLTGYLYLFKLCITSKSPKKLVLLDFEQQESENDQDRLVIDAPWIQEIDISGSWFASIRLSNVSSLSVSARLSFSHDKDWYTDAYSDPACTHDVFHMLNMVSAAKNLILGPLFIQVLSYLTFRGDCFLKFDCRHMTLESCIQKDELSGIAFLLNNSDKLETLTVTNTPAYASRFLPDSFRRSWCTSGVEFLNAQAGNFPLLKKVRFNHCGALCFKDKFNRRTEFYEATLAEFILKYSSAVEEITISTPKDVCKHCKVTCGKLYLPALSHKLLGRCLIKKGNWIVREAEGCTRLILTFRR